VLVSGQQTALQVRCAISGASPETLLATLQTHGAVARSTGRAKSRACGVAGGPSARRAAGGLLPAGVDARRPRLRDRGRRRARRKGKRSALVDHQAKNKEHKALVAEMETGLKRVMLVAGVAQRLLGKVAVVTGAPGPPATAAAQCLGTVRRLRQVPWTHCVLLLHATDQALGTRWHLEAVQRRVRLYVCMSSQCVSSAHCWRAAESWLWRAQGAQRASAWRARAASATRAAESSSPTWTTRPPPSAPQGPRTSRARHVGRTRGHTQRTSL